MAELQMMLYMRYKIKSGRTDQFKTSDLTGQWIFIFIHYAIHCSIGNVIRVDYHFSKHFPKLASRRFKKFFRATGHES